MASKSHKPKTAKTPIDALESPKSQEQVNKLIRKNGELVEGLLQSPVWTEILEPLLDETFASVAGRKTNGRYHHGEFTRGQEKTLEFLRGYQKCVMDIYNRLDDFVRAKNKLGSQKREEESAARQPMINPFLEEKDDWDTSGS